MPKARIALSFMALTVILLVAGCGGGDSTQALTKAQLIAQGDAICRKGNEAKESGLSEYAKEHPGGAKSKAEEEEFIAAVALPPLEEEFEGLKGLGTPKTGAAQYEATLAALEAAIAEAEEDPLVLSNPKTSPLSKADTLAGEYGFKGCSSFL